MKWSFNQLLYSKKKQISFKTSLILDNLKKRRKDLIHIDPVDIKGNLIIKNNGILGNYIVNTNLILPSTRNLKPVDIDMNFNFSEYYVKNSNISFDQNINEVVINLSSEYINLDEIISDNILARIPIKITKQIQNKNNSNIISKGIEWEAISEDYYKSRYTVNENFNNQLSNLKKLLVENDENKLQD